jgi:hypothetical protein
MAYYESSGKSEYPALYPHMAEEWKKLESTRSKIEKKDVSI